MSGPFLNTIFEQADRTALSTWLENPQAHTLLPESLGWKGTVDADLGRDLCAVLTRTKGWSGGLIIAHLLPRLIHRRTSKPHHQAFVHAVVLHLGQPDIPLSIEDGHNILMGLHLFDAHRDAGLPHHPFFSPIYNALARAMPLDVALADAGQKIRGSFTSNPMPIAILLGTYGMTQFGPIQSLLRNLHSRGIFERRGSDENTLLGNIAHASAHTTLQICRRLDLKTHQNLAPYLLWRHFLQAAQRQMSTAP